MASNRALRVDSAEESKAMMLSVLDDEPGPARDIVVLNTGVALYAANRADTMQAGVALAREAVASGKALAKMHQFVARTKELQAA
jgi:anthranilate phosphoribosyltransferase